MIKEMCTSWYDYSMEEMCQFESLRVALSPASDDEETLRQKPGNSVEECLGEQSLLRDFMDVWNPNVRFLVVLDEASYLLPSKSRDD